MDRLASIAAAAARLDEPTADSNNCNDVGNKASPTHADVSNFASSMKEKDDSVSTSVVEVTPPSVPFSGEKSWEESCDMQSSPATQVQVKGLVGISTAATGNSPPPKIPNIPKMCEFGRTSECQETTRNVTSENPSHPSHPAVSHHSRVVSLADSESSCESPPAKRIATPKTKRSSSSSTSTSTSGDVPPGEAVDLINENDVLCGRGGETNHHPGNVRYRTLVKQHQRDYLAAKRRDKPRIARLIVQEVRTAGGRFLKKDSAGTWRDVGSGKAREKTSQALREGAPELRNTDTPTTDDAFLPATTCPTNTPSPTIPHSSNQNDEIIKSPSRVSSSSCSDNEFSYFSSDEAQHQQDPQPQMMIMGHKRKRDSGLVIPQAADFTDTAASLLQLSLPSSASSSPAAAATISANDDEYSSSSALQSYPPHFKEASTRGPRLKLLKARLTSA